MTLVKLIIRKWKENRSEGVIIKKVLIRRKKRKYVASFVLPSIVFVGSVSRLAKGIRKYKVATYFERVEGPPFLFVSYLRIYKGTYRTHLRTE
jgi:hypothetical protein